MNVFHIQQFEDKQILNWILIIFQNLQEAAESLIDTYPNNENLLLRDVPYINVNRLQNISDQVWRHLWDWFWFCETFIVLP